MEPKHIISTLGRDAVCARLGVKPGAVAKAVLAGKLPASWYAALSDMIGHDLPRDVFTFKGLSP